MDKELLNKLAEKRLSFERKIAKKQVLSDEMHGKWAELEKEIFALKRERSRISMDIRLICTGKEPQYSSQFKKKKKKPKKKR